MDVKIGASREAEKNTVIVYWKRLSWRLRHRPIIDRQHLPSMKGCGWRPLRLVARMLITSANCAPLNGPLLLSSNSYPAQWPLCRTCQQAPYSAKSIASPLHAGCRVSAPTTMTILQWRQIALIRRILSIRWYQLPPDWWSLRGFITAARKLLKSQAKWGPFLLHGMPRPILTMPIRSKSNNLFGILQIVTWRVGPTMLGLSLIRWLADYRNKFHATT